jgi:hypothetical protein
LFHSEDGTVEEMPFKHLWPPAFSPDGRWLLLDERSIQDETERRTLWVRPSDPPGSQVTFLAAGETAAWTARWDRAAFGQPERSQRILPRGAAGRLTTGLPGLGALLVTGWGQIDGAGGVPGEWRQALFLVEADPNFPGTKPIFDVKT